MLTKDNDLQDNENRIEVLIENINDTIIETDVNGNITYLSPQSYQMFGYHPEEVIGSKAFDFIRPEHRDTITKSIQDIITENMVKNFQFDILHKDGHYVHIASRGGLIHSAGEWKLLGVLRDITPQKMMESKLRESELKYRYLFESSPLLIILLDLQGTIIDLNQTTLRYISLKREDLIGKSFKDLNIIKPENLAQINHLFKQLITEGYIEPQELKVDIKGFKMKWILVQASLVHFENTKLLQATVQDITAKKEAEENLKASEKQLRNIIESINDAIVITDLSGKIKYISPQLSQMLGGLHIETEREFFHYIHPDDMSFLFEHYKEGVKSRRVTYTKPIELRVKSKEGRYIWFSTSSRNYYDANEDIMGFITTLKDITSEKIAQQKLHESQERYRYIYENSPNAISLTDDKGHILQTNKAHEKIFGYRECEVIGKNFTELGIFDLEQIKIIKEYFKNNLRGIRNPPLEFQIKRKNGELAWISYQHSLINVDDKMLVETIAHDITEEKKAKMLIIEENKKLLEINKIKNELVSRVSHELKTPLTSIYGASQILLELYSNKTCQEAFEIIEMIYKGGKRLKLLIDNLLDISRIESENLMLTLNPENIVDIVEECANDLKLFANQRKISINLSLPENAVVKVDKVRIEQVFMNLISNAIKNTYKEGKIEIQVDERNDCVYVKVKDSGVGITNENMDHLFKKFGKIERYGQRLDIDTEGSGLGLYISKEIIDMHGGSIWVESEGKDKGSTFIVKLFKESSHIQPI